MLNFKKFLEMNTVGKHNDGPGGAYLASTQTGSEQSATQGYTGKPLFLPSYDLSLPTVTKTKKIVRVEMKTNPIKVLLSDSTALLFTRDEFDRIKGSRPSPGKLMVVTFQRQPGDNSQTPSQIQDIICQG